MLVLLILLHKRDILKGIKPLVVSLLGARLYGGKGPINRLLLRWAYPFQLIHHSLLLINDGCLGIRHGCHDTYAKSQ